MIRLLTIRQAAYLFCIVAVILLGGCSPELSQPSQNTPPTLTAIPSPTVVPEPSKVPPTPSAEAQVATVEPMATAPMLRFDSWSPTSDFIAYWTFTAEEAAISYPPGNLNFLNVQTGLTCAYPYAVTSGTSLVWQSAGKIIVFSDMTARLGTPCDNDFVVVTDTAGVSENTFDPSVSPNGGYSVTTTAIRNDDETLNATTTVVDARTGDVKNVIEWRQRVGEGDLGLGGQWLTEGVFLIYETLDQGPLLVSIGKGVIPLVPDIFGALGLKDSVSLTAVGAVVTGTNTYQIVLSGGFGVAADFPEIRLYHSDTKEVEEMPFQYIWTPSFSPDGRWLFFDTRPDKNGYGSHEIWFRPVDPAGSTARRLVGGDSIYLAWSPDMARIAVPSPQGISLLAFPDGTQVSSWETKDYQATPIAWSPNGEYFAAYGYISGVQQELCLLSEPHDNFVLKTKSLLTLPAF